MCAVALRSSRVEAEKVLERGPSSPLFREEMRRSHPEGAGPAAGGCGASGGVDLPGRTATAVCRPEGNALGADRPPRVARGAAEPARGRGAGRGRPTTAGSERTARRGRSRATARGGGGRGEGQGEPARAVVDGRGPGPSGGAAGRRVGEVVGEELRGPTRRAARPRRCAGPAGPVRAGGPAKPRRRAGPAGPVRPGGTGRAECGALPSPGGSYARVAAFARIVSMTAWTAVTKFWGSSNATKCGASRAI